MELTPDLISPDFCDHIRAEREHVRPLKAVDPLYFQGWCVDAFDTDTEQPDGWKISRGVMVAGADLRRALANDIPGLEDPYAWLQKAAQSSGGRLVQVNVHAHRRCGELFTTHGAITPEEQRQLIEAGFAKWGKAYHDLRRLNPIDAAQIEEMTFSIGSRGSAPVVELTDQGLYHLVNPDFPRDRFPLGPEFTERLAAPSSYL
jgi:hypothetical protein